MNDLESDEKTALASQPESRNKEEREYPTHECEVCQTEMYGLHCKIICPNCGYRRDCSDP